MEFTEKLGLFEVPFNELLADFEARRAVLLSAGKAALRIDDCRRRLHAQQGAVTTIEKAIEQATRDLASKRDELSVQRLLVESHRATLDQMRAASLPNLWDRLLALFGRETSRMAALRQALELPTLALAEGSRMLANLAREVAADEAQLKRQGEQLRSLQTELVAVEREHQRLQKAVQAGYDTGARHFPDAKLWSLPTAERQRASVAVSPALDGLRARIFLQAVELHRLTVLANAGKFIANLRAVHGMLTGSLRDKLPLDRRPLLWDAFFFVVPVVSTTLASFDRLFVGMGQESLGWLLIDEAGQATPQSAAGAIWRSQRAVLIGDPLQIEPVFTVPLGLVEDFRRRHGVAPRWSPTGESVQTLADRITPFGSWVAQSKAGNPGERERIWTGMPLRTHRRCDDPMFSVANAIAYAGQMVQGRVDDNGEPMPIDFDCVLGESRWIDVRGDAKQHPVVEDEIAALIECLQRLRARPAITRPDKPAKIFVISPFRKVKNACAARLKKAGLSNVECGTVHTFQGKEAEIVFLVLGTAPGQAGAGARDWASGKPNLLNVAITRAKCRLYVIGNAQEWSRLDYFSELHAALAVKRISAAEAFATAD
ncbi:MAG: AAA domain-containing protein [Zoogloea sp.]|nr:AAA domain-containing protein [Zoogloea sp.]